MTATLFSPNDSMTDVELGLLLGRRGCGTAPPPAAATATGAAADTPHFSSSAFTSSTISMIGFARQRVDQLCVGQCHD